MTDDFIPFMQDTVLGHTRLGVLVMIDFWDDRLIGRRSVDLVTLFAKYLESQGIPCMVVSDYMTLAHPLHGGIIKQLLTNQCELYEPTSV
jgi:hypothetical protein